MAAEKGKNDRNNKRLNDYERRYIERIKERLNEKLDESGLLKTELYDMAVQRGFTFSDRALYNLFSYGDTSLNSRVMLAIIQILNIDCNWLFAEEDVKQTAAKQAEENEMFQCLRDNGYMNKYYCYMYRPTYQKLYDSCTLEMKLDENGGSMAVLELKDRHNWNGEESGTIHYTYQGVPVVCVREQAVYMNLTAPNGYYMYLCFDYRNYRQAKMYYRTAVAVMINPLTLKPQFQKMIISLRPLNESELSYAEGILKTSSDEFFISRENLERMFQNHGEEAFMQQFKKEYSPFLELMRMEGYRLSARALLNYTISHMDNKARMQAILLLKKYSCCQNEVAVGIFEELPRMMKEGMV